MNSQIKLWLKDEKSIKNSFDKYLKKGMIKKEVLDLDNLTNLHFQRSKNDVSFAGRIIDDFKENLNWSIVCSYYGSYHGALALLIKKGYSSKSHIATICALIYFYYKKGLSQEDICILHLLSENSIENFDELKSQRERASYGVGEEYEEMIAKKLRDMAIEFSNKVYEILYGED